MPTKNPRQSRAYTFADHAPAPRCKPETDGLADPASTGFRLLCLDRAIAATPTEAPIETIIGAAVQIRAFLLGEHGAQAREHVRVTAQAEAQTHH